MITNVGLSEFLYLRFLKENARIEIVDEKDLQAKNLKPLTKRIAESIHKKHPDLKMLGIYRSNCMWNFEHPLIAGMFYGYVIPIPKDYDLFSLKRTCMKLEINDVGNRFCDIDVYRSVFDKISRKDINNYNKQ